MGLFGTSTTWRSFRVTDSRCGAIIAQSSGEILVSRRLRTSAREEMTSVMDFSPTSTDMVGSPFGSESGRPASRQSPPRELSELAIKTYAYFSTETYEFCAILTHQILRVQTLYNLCTERTPHQRRAAEPAARTVETRVR